MQKRNFLRSLNDAVEGFVHVIKHERNMRIHFFIGFLILLSALLLGVSRLEWIILFITVNLVLASEMANTVIEDIMDVVEDAFHPAVRLIKDMAAGIVLIAVLNSLVVGVLILSKYLSWPLAIAAHRLRFTPWHITLVSLLVVVFLVVTGKAFLHRGTPLKGGPVSGHSAVAFSLWTAVLFTQTNIFVIFATLLLALLVVQSRVRAKIHTVWEAFTGALLGILVTSLLFQLLR